MRLTSGRNAICEISGISAVRSVYRFGTWYSRKYAVRRYQLSRGLPGREAVLSRCRTNIIRRSQQHGPEPTQLPIRTRRDHSVIPSHLQFITRLRYIQAPDRILRCPDAGEPRGGSNKPLLKHAPRDVQASRRRPPHPPPRARTHTLLRSIPLRGACSTVVCLPLRKHHTTSLIIAVTSIPRPALTANAPPLCSLTSGRRRAAAVRRPYPSLAPVSPPSARPERPLAREQAHHSPLKRPPNYVRSGAAISAATHALHPPAATDFVQQHPRAHAPHSEHQLPPCGAQLAAKVNVGLPGTCVCRPWPLAHALQ